MKEAIQAIESLVTTVGIFIGAIWTYILFVKKRQQYPIASIEQIVGHFPLTDKLYLVHVTTKIINKGEVLLSLENAETRLQQVVPVRKIITKKITSGNQNLTDSIEGHEWPLLGRKKWDWKEKIFEIEPKETDYLRADFVIKNNVKRIRIYSYINNSTKKKNIGWTHSSFYELNKGDSKMSKSKPATFEQQEKEKDPPNPKKP